MEEYVDNIMVNTGNNADDTLQTVNEEELFDLIKNDKIKMIISDRIDMNYNKRLLELLKKNKSVTKLYLSIHCSKSNTKHGDEFYKILHDFLTTETYLEFIQLEDKYISVENCKLVGEALKSNSSLIEISFTYYNLGNNALKYLIDPLKFNTNISFVRISVWDNFIDGTLIAELLKIKTTLSAIALYTHEIKNSNVIDGLLQNNSNITFFYTYCSLGPAADRNIQSYCERNKHNFCLKSMMIQDLC
jgi:hypothetical protein